jgi:hypothetical protein
MAKHAQSLRFSVPLFTTAACTSHTPHTSPPRLSCNQSAQQRHHQPRAALHKVRIVEGRVRLLDTLAPLFTTVVCTSHTTNTTPCTFIGFFLAFFITADDSHLFAFSRRGFSFFLGVGLGVSAFRFAIALWSRVSRVNCPILLPIVCDRFAVTTCR